MIEGREIEEREREREREKGCGERDVNLRQRDIDTHTATETAAAETADSSVLLISFCVSHLLISRLVLRCFMFYADFIHSPLHFALCTLHLVYRPSSFFFVGFRFWLLGFIEAASAA